MTSQSVIVERTASLKVGGDQDTRASLAMLRSSLLQNSGRSREVRSHSLRYYICNHALSHIHLLKLDVEGNEMKTLQGLGDYLNSQFIDCIQFEYGNCNLSSEYP
jgi:FkbM family methyltransferase